MKALEPALPLNPTPVRIRAGAKLLIVSLYTLVFFVALPLALLRLGRRIDVELPLSVPSPHWRWPLALAATLGGAALLFRAGWELWRRGHGLPISHLPPRVLVESGPFGKLRHPIYVGYTLALSGIGLLLESPGVALFAPLLLSVGWLGYAHQIEEPMLRRRFGQSYLDYVERTRLLPLPTALVARTASLLNLVWCAVRPPTDWLAQRTVLFRVGSTLWVGYGAFVALGAAVAGALGMALLAPAMPAPASAAYLLGISLAMLLGGRAAWLIYEGRALVARPGATLKRVGFVSFGAYAAMFVYAAAWSRLHPAQVSLGWLLDRTMASALVCSAFGRLGCLSYGCCYGRVWAGGICHRDPNAKVNREHGSLGSNLRVPTQLLAALLAFLSSLLMLGVLAAGASPGFATGFGALCYALLRFHIEGLRDEQRFVDARLTRGQLLCAAIAAVALSGLAVSPGAEQARQAGLTFEWPGARQLAFSALSAVVVFLVCGYHRERVGSW